MLSDSVDNRRSAACTVGGLWLSISMEQPTGTPTTPAGVVAAANSLVGLLDDNLWAAKGSEELVDAVAEAESLRAHLAAVEASMLAEIDARQIPKKELAWGSTADWFTHLAGHHPRQGAPHRPAGTDPGRRADRHPRRHARRPGLAGAGRGDRDRRRQAPPERRGARRTRRRCSSGRRPGWTRPSSARPPSAWSSWPTRTRRSGTRRRPWTGRTGPPTTAATCPSPRTAPAASGSGAAAPSRTPPCSRPRCCR